LREPDYGCGRYVCDDPSAIPMWLVVILLIVLVLLLVSIVQPAKKEPPPLKKAVDDVLEGFQKQARVWDDKKAETAFDEARKKVSDVIDKYKSKPI
jgi:hypothetical protein